VGSSYIGVIIDPRVAAGTYTITEFILLLRIVVSCQSVTYAMKYIRNSYLV
jgi:hypothetical protein